MTFPDVALTVIVSAATTLLVTMRGQLRLLFMRRPKPVDPDVMESIMRSALHTAVNAYGPPGTRPSAPKPPVE